VLENAPIPGQGDGWSVGQKTTWLIENSVVELQAGAYTRPLFSSTCAVSDT